MASLSDDTRRRFLAHFTAAGLGTTLAPGVLWARLQDAGTATITLEMLTGALKVSGIDLTEDERKSMLEAANQNLARYEELRAVHIPNDVSPPFHFSPVVPGMVVDKGRKPFRLSPAPKVSRPAHLEDAAFWPVRHLAELLRTKQVTSVELTTMYLARLHRYNGLLNNVVTFLDEVGLVQAKQADAEIAAGKYKGPLHGIPWGAKDIISVRGYTTTWGSPAFKEQQFDYDASIVEMLREAGAVLIAKLTTGELAGGDRWFGGQTKSPWDPTQGSSGSSAGPSSATAAGCVGFAIGSETSGSILSPAARCGLAGLRPTFGRVSRYGVMALSWTLDRLGPLCRYAEDCAIVMQAVARPDGRDMSVTDVPFNYDAALAPSTLRVGILQASFDEITDATVGKNAAATLATLKALGVKEFVPITIPAATGGNIGFGVESTAFFDEHARKGHMKEARGGGRPAGRLIPGVEYLQSQRVRMMMMQALAEATKDVDVYVVGANLSAGDPPAARPEGAPPPPPRPERLQTPTQRHFSMANLAGYPAINVPSGFGDAGTPSNVVFYGWPYAEAKILALARAYQDAAKHHLKTPERLKT